LAPITVGPRAIAKLDRRSTKVASWYLDFSMIRNYWSDGGRAYHHTAPISMNYALHQALALVLEEGLEIRWRRHQLHSSALISGLEALGFEPFAAPGHRLPMLNSVRLPGGLEDAAVRRELLETYDIEIGGGLGDLAGKVWRIGLMGESARRSHVLNLLTSLEEILHRRGHRPTIGKGIEAAAAVYAAP
jgi:alanine-glyoxylate transaminase/serine-glyoxylate transaminase/serine-pyruvate transaminase